MKASELRIGNYVYSWFNGKHNEWPLNLDDLTEIFMDKNHTYKPIPLTEEWLIKFGFESDTITFKNDGLCIGWFSGDKFFYLPTWQLQYRHKKQIEYVHQLQNLYFALTGEELEIVKFETKLYYKRREQ